MTDTEGRKTWWKQPWVWAVVAVLLIIGAFAGGNDKDDKVIGSGTTVALTVDTTTTTTAPPVTTAAPTTVVATTTAPPTTMPVDWADKVREKFSVDADLIESAEVVGNALDIRTGRYLGNDDLVEGWAATVCFAAQEAGWPTDIEILDPNGRILAATFSKPDGRYMCMGQTFGTGN